MSPKGTHLLFVVASDTHVDMCHPIARYAGKNAGLTTIALSIRPFFFDSEYPDGKLQQHFDIVFALKDHIKGSPRRLGQRIRNRVLGRLNGFQNSDERLQRTTDFFSKFLQKYPLVAAYFCNDRVFPDTLLIGELRKAGVPTVLLQESIRRDLANTQISKNGAGGCDLVMAWGRTSYEYYRKVGVAADSIRLVGSPRIDTLVTSANDTTEQIRRKWSIPMDRKLYFIASNPIYDMGIEGAMSKMQYLISLHKLVYSILDFSENFAVIIKPHSLERQFWETMRLAEYFSDNDRVVVSTKMPISEAVQISEATFIFNSTVALEAALFQKPSAVINFFNTLHGCDFVETGLSTEIRNSDDLKSFLKDPMQPSKSAVNSYLHEISGNMGRYLEGVI